MIAFRSLVSHYAHSAAMTYYGKNNPPLSGLGLAPGPNGPSTASWFLSGQTDATGPIRRIALNSFPFLVGRSSDAGLCLNARSVSKNHAELLLEGEQLWIRDLNSTNGTYANGERLHAPIQLNNGDLVQFASLVFRIGREESKTMGHTSAEQNLCDHALALMQFDRLINDGGVFPYYQPIVSFADGQPVAFEVLGRSRIYGITTPADMFNAAAQLNQTKQLSALFRGLGVSTAVQNKLGSNLFLNTHPHELGSTELIESLNQLRGQFPDELLTLEIHEQAVTNNDMFHELRAALCDLSIQLAFDDFGQGQTRIIELSEVRPNYLKFDMGLTRGIHKASADRQKVVSMLARMVNELGIVSLAEGVESQGDQQVLAEMGFQLGQGFFFGRPAAIGKYAPPSQPPPRP
jgi:EAL domain-containing protein (putative c-di-GMP-specific phosphodiesterase class I)